MNKWFTGFAILSAVLSGVLFGGSSVSAASDWDNVLQVTNNLILTDLDNPNNTNDYTNNWYLSSLDALATGLGENDPAVDEFEQVLSVEGNKWAVFKSADGLDMYIAYTTSPSGNGSINFFTDGGNPYWQINGTNVKVLQVSYAPSNQYASASGLLYRSIFNSGIASGGGIDVFLSTFPVTYPAGYEGEEIPTGTNDTPELSSEFKMYVNRLEVRDTTDYGSAYMPDECWYQMPNNVQGDNFNNYYYDCENPDWIKHNMPEVDQTYTIIQFARFNDEIISKSHTIDLDVIGQEPAELTNHHKYNDLDFQVKDTTNYGSNLPDECWFQIPNNQAGDNFTEYYFDCESPEWISHKMPEFYEAQTFIQFARYGNQTISKSFTVNIDGGVFDSEVDVTGIFEKCINEDFPYIHIKDCVGAFGSIVNKLSFGNINLFSKFYYESPTDCQEIGKMGDWLGLSNKYVCPQFSADVRNTVTPFITFGLALAVIGAITTKSRWEMT